MDELDKIVQKIEFVLRCEFNQGTKSKLKEEIKKVQETERPRVYLEHKYITDEINNDKPIGGFH